MLNPTGQGRYASSTLSLISTEFTTEQDLSVQIEAPDGKVVGTLKMTRGGDTDPSTYTVVLDGKDTAGGNLPDGTYKVRVMWNGQSYVYTSITIDAILPSVRSAQVTPNPFRETARIRAEFSEFVYWFIDIFDEKGQSIAMREGQGMEADDLWDGRDRQGMQVPDGTYTTQFWLIDRGGNEVKVKGPSFRRKQSIGIKDFQISRKTIAPGNPETGTATISITVDDEVTYRWDLLADSGIPLRSLGGGAGPSAPAKIVFDGTDNQGYKLAAGRYKWTLSMKDAYGNSSLGNGDFTVDPDAPLVNAGEAPVVTLQEMLYLPYRAVDSSGVQVKVRRQHESGFTQELVMDDSATELAIPLIVGTQTVTVTAVDSVGNAVVNSYVVTRLAEPRLGVFVGGRPVTSDVAPEIVEGRTVLPLRAVAEALGFAIEWDDATRTITMRKGENTVVMSIGSTSATVNGKPREMEVAPFIKEERTMVPVRFISEGLGFKIEWDAATRSVIIK